MVKSNKRKKRKGLLWWRNNLFKDSRKIKKRIGFIGSGLTGGTLADRAPCGAGCCCCILLLLMLMFGGGFFGGMFGFTDDTTTTTTTTTTSGETTTAPTTTTPEVQEYTIQAMWHWGDVELSILPRPLWIPPEAPHWLELDIYSNDGLMSMLDVVWMYDYDVWYPCFYEYHFRADTSYRIYNFDEYDYGLHLGGLEYQIVTPGDAIVVWTLDDGDYTVGSVTIEWIPI